MSEPRSLAFVDSITYVELRDLPHGGPFWDHERWTGDSSEKARLLRRLRAELPPSITVADSPG